MTVVVLLLPSWSHLFSGSPCCCKLGHCIQMGLRKLKQMSKSICCFLHMSFAGNCLVLALKNNFLMVGSVLAGSVCIEEYFLKQV